MQSQPVANAAPFAALGFAFQSLRHAIPIVRGVRQIGQGKMQMPGYLPGYVQASAIFLIGMDIGIIKKAFNFVAFALQPLDDSRGTYSAANVKDYFYCRPSSTSIT